MLADDIKQDIKNSFCIRTKDSKDRFPLCEKASIIMEKYSTRNISLPGSLKNVLESLTGVVYTDYSHFEGNFVRKHSHENAVDNVSIYIIACRAIKYISDISETLEHYCTLKSKVDTIIENNYIPNPHIDSFNKPFNKNLLYYGFLMILLEKEFTEKIGGQLN
jgi:hypothetical protein